MSIGRLEHYEVEGLLSRGGMGDVYHARDTHLECKVALKVLPAGHDEDARERARLLGEARLLAKLDHPNVVGVFGCGEAAPDPPGFLWPDSPGPHPARVAYVAMHFVEGEDLREKIGPRPLPVRTVIEYTLQIARGLEAAHTHGIVHGDLKPANIRVTPDGTLKLVDFGLASVRRVPVGPEDSTRSFTHPSNGGTAHYMAPERSDPAGVTDARSDLFSLGVIVFEMVTSHRPFEGANWMSVLHAIATANPPPMARYAADVPGELERIVRKLLCKEPGRRYQSAHEVITDLEQLTSPLHPKPTPPWRTRLARAGRWLLRPIQLALIAALAIELAGPVWRWIRPPAQTVAVAAFENTTGETTLDAVARGLDSDLITSLTSGIRAAVVRPTLRSEAGGPERDPWKLAQTYGVQLVLLGTLRDPDGRAGERLVLHVEAISAKDNRVAWAEDCEAPRERPGDLRASLVRQVLAHFPASTAIEASTALDVTERPAGASEHYLRGLGWLADPDTPAARDSALAEFDRALALDPGYGRALAGRARARWWLWAREHDPALLERAEQDARQAAASAPSEIEGHLALARILQERGDAAHAIEALRAVLGRNERLADVHALLGSAYGRQGQLALARESYATAVALQPGSPTLWNACGAFLLMSLGDAPGAEHAFERVVALAPEQNRGYEHLAAAYTLECRYEEALRTYERLPHPEHMHATARSNRATALFFLRREQEALPGFLEAVSGSPQDGHLRLNLGDCYERLGRRGQASIEYREACRLLERDLVANPADAYVRAQLAMGLAKLGDTARARGEIERHLAALPAESEALHSLAKALALCGDRERALTALDTLVTGRRFAPCLLRVEDELASLRSDRRFRALVGASASRSPGR